MRIAATSSPKPPGRRISEVASPVDPLAFPSWKNLSNDGRTAVLQGMPWDWDVSAEEVARVRSMAKLDRKKYMVRADISWHMYSAIKGENWFHPVSAENPPYQIMAFVADYDLPLQMTHVESACRELLKLGMWCPTHVETSLSKHVRCVWRFAKPVLCSSRKFADEFLARLGKLIGVEALLPGLDRKSFNCEMRWTNGGYWLELEGAKMIPSDVLTGVAIKTTQAVMTKRCDLPLDKVAQLLAEKYPRFIDFGALKPGALGIRFWDATADNPNGAMVVDRGFACVTGEVALMTWEQLLTPAIIENLRMTNYGEITQDIFYDGSKYWVRESGQYKNWEIGATMLRIASMGFDRTRRKDELMSQAETILSYVHTSNRIDGVAPLLYRPPGLVEYQGNRLLNITRTKPLPMADGPCNPLQFPWLWGFFEVFFAHPHLLPREYFFAWWQRFYRGAIDQKSTSGHAIFICGPIGCGKNLISELILPVSMGGTAPNPYKYLMGETDFSDDLFSSPILAINDEDAPPEFRKSGFEQKMKALVANNEHSYHAKYGKKTRMEWDGRLIVTLNDGPKDIGLLPQRNAGTEDKMGFFLAQRHKHPFYDKQKNREVVSQELPYFLRWLYDTYEAPAETQTGGRFGVASYYDPELVRTNRQEQVSYNLLELLGAWMASNAKWNNGADEWVGTPTDLLREMTRDTTLEILLRTWDTTKMARSLSDLVRARTPGIQSPAKNSRRITLCKSQVLASIDGKETAPKEQQTEL